MTKFKREGSKETAAIRLGMVIGGLWLCKNWTVI